MGFYNETDIKVSPSGDLNVSSNGDLELTSASGVLKQDITFRVRTNYGEYAPHEGVGANLDSLIGEPNSMVITKKGTANIVHSLTQDGMVRATDLYVRGVPISLDNVVYYVFVNDEFGVLNVTPDLVANMTNGIGNSHELTS